MSSFVSLQNVSLAYGGKGTPKAVEGVDLEIAKGEFIAIVGPSGCGKSSFLKLVSGLMLPTEGTVDLNGSRVRGPLGNVGMAFQNPTLLPWRNILSNVLLPLEIVPEHKRKFRRDKAPYLERAQKLLGMVGLHGVESKAPWELSGGMQQRASLCRALIHQPEVLLLDEPFAALDAFTREELWGALQDLWLATHCTVILVTHDLREAVYLADTIYVMGGKPGKMIHTQRNPLARPRTLEGMFEADFSEQVQGLRGLIGAVREAQLNPTQAGSVQAGSVGKS
jgi:NitT/TauT family transport system ATP-binding protein